MSGAKMLLECLVREGVDCFFGYPGGVTLPLYDAVYDHPIRHVLVRHEENAAFAAEGYARAHGKGGGLLRDLGARRDQPGHGPDERADGFDSDGGADRAGAFQADRQRRVPGSRHVRHHALLHQAQLPGEEHRRPAADRSTRRSTSPPAGRPGPVLVDIPKDVFQGQAHYTPVTSIHLPGYKVFTEGHTGQIRRAAQMI